MELTTLKRIFRYNGEKLPEISPHMTPEQHIKHYSGIYPEMAIGKAVYKEVEDGVAMYDILVKPGDRS